MLETRTLQQSVENVARTLGIPKELVVSAIEQAYLLKRHATVADTAKLLAFLASDGAATITGAIMNASSGTILD
jgi:enoyl-[acyl-carrier-protein] reductase (NADH)